MSHGLHQPLLETVFARLAVAQQQCTGTEKAKVVQGLNDRNTFRGACAIDARRENCEGVVHMNDVRPLLAQYAAKLRAGTLRPDRVERIRSLGSQRGIMDVIVASLEG